MWPLRRWPRFRVHANSSGQAGQHGPEPDQLAAAGWKQARPGLCPPASRARDRAPACHHAHCRSVGLPAGARGYRSPESALHCLKSGRCHGPACTAAVLPETLSMDTPGTAGHRRVTFPSADVFLCLNRYRLQADAGRVHRQPTGIPVNNPLHRRRTIAMALQDGNCTRDSHASGPERITGLLSGGLFRSQGGFQQAAMRTHR